MQRDPKAVEFQGVSQLGRRNVFPSEGALFAAIPPHRGNRADEHDVRPWNLQPMAGEPRRKLYSSGIEGGTSTPNMQSDLVSHLVPRVGNQRRAAGATFVIRPRRVVRMEPQFQGWTRPANQSLIPTGCRALSAPQIYRQSA